MKVIMNKTLMSGMTICLAITVLISCKKSQEEIVSPAPVAEGVMDIRTQPIAASSPTLDKVFEDTSTLVFPRNKSANMKTDLIGTTDLVDFDDESALSLIPEYAANTFATFPFYIQQVGTAWIHVKENSSGPYASKFLSNNGHFHLSYQNFVPCYSNGILGKPLMGQCTKFNPLKEPRSVDTHNGDEWIKIYAYDYNTKSRVFDLLQIQVTNDPIQLWFKKKSGEWLFWSSIPAGVWNFTQYCTSITEVLISSAGHKGSIGFDNVKVNVPFY
jgi:hypothetical protein